MPEAIYCELEIDLRQVGNVYSLTLQYSSPDNAALIAPARGSFDLNLTALLPYELDQQAYGEELATQLYHDGEVLDYFVAKMAETKGKGQRLRLILKLDPNAPELQRVRWELLTDPKDREPLATSVDTPFSRWIFSQDNRPVRLRARERGELLKVLVAVSAPTDIEEYRLAQVDWEGEMERARNSFAPDKEKRPIDAELATVKFLGGDQGPVTLEALSARLLDNVDILYLVAHGGFIPGEGALLYLQNDAGKTEAVNAATLTARIKDLDELPRLVVLASCDSGKGDGASPDDGEPAAHAAFAPQLADAGVPAILAMQGQITMETVEAAMPIFFRELVKDGQIDRALAAARGIVRDRPDQWMLGLYLRLNRGCVWYEPGFALSEQGDDDFERWDSVCTQVENSRFIPIIGPDVGEHVFGTTGELARQLAEERRLPLDDRDRSDLAKVAQYLSISQSHNFARHKVETAWRRQLVDRNAAAFGVDDTPAGRERRRGLLSPRTWFTKLIPPIVKHDRREAKAVAGASEGSRGQTEPDAYRLLADLPAKVYLTASPDTLLYEHLKDATCKTDDGVVAKRPETLFSPWRRTESSHPTRLPYANKPDEKRPVVYHVFGVFADPEPKAEQDAEVDRESLVLTEDDFFDYLIATPATKLWPTMVSGELTRSSLIFLGFPLNAWTFRVLFRLIMTLEGRAKLLDRTHVGVQVDPESHSRAEAEQVRKYLEGLYTRRGDEPRVEIYWGSATDFLRELRQRLGKPATPDTAGNGKILVGAGD